MAYRITMCEKKRTVQHLVIETGVKPTVNERLHTLFNMNIQYIQLATRRNSCISFPAHKGRAIAKRCDASPVCCIIETHSGLLSQT